MKRARRAWAAAALSGGLALLAVGLLGCEAERLDATPEGAARALVEQLSRLDGSEKEAKAAYELLSQRTRENLEARAARYSAASGKHIEPEMMIAPQSFVPRFEVRSYETIPSGPGFATVRAHGVSEGEVAELHCVREDGGWRVEIDLPPLAPVVVRPREDSRPLPPR